MIVVSPYRPFPAESSSHRQLDGAFDWIAALRMLATSVRRSCGCDTVALTDVDTNLPVPAYRYQTAQRRLMLWILEISLAYLQSDDFTQDTIFITPDTVVCRDLRPYFAGDLTILVRSQPKYHNRPILNALQWWPVRAKDRLAAFYADTLTLALQMPDNLIRWGADSESLRQRLAPMTPGLQSRAGLSVSMREANTVLLSITNSIMANMDRGRSGAIGTLPPVVDFKGPIRKRYMARYFHDWEQRCA